MSHVSPVKIGLKTKDDEFFIREWVDHHLAIVGPESIFIADNGSTHPDVLEYYKSLSGDILIFSFRGLHNDIHDRRMYPELHSSLLLSSNYFQILDTDERLVWIDRNSYVADKSLVDKLMKLSPMEAAFGIWISNLGGERNQFLVGPESVLFSAILWGKSLQSSARMLPQGQKLHNCQLPATIRNSFDYTPQICVLHLKNLSTEHRLRSARNKLIARKAILPKWSPEEIERATLLPGALPGSVHYHEQYKRLVRGECSWEYSEAAKRNSVKFVDDGSIIFASSAAKKSFQLLFDQPAELAKQAFSQYADLNPE